MEHGAADVRTGESGTPHVMPTYDPLRAADIIEKVHAVLKRK